MTKVARVFAAILLVALTLSAGVTVINLTNQVSGLLPGANGGTGVNSTATFPASGTVMITTTGVTAAQMPALTGDCTTSAGAVASTCTQINGSNFTVNSSGLPTKVDGITTAGQGVGIVQCITSAKVETGADAAVLSCTPAAAVGAYEVCIRLDVSAASAATLGWTMTWTNSKGTALAPTNMSLFQMGVAAPALTFAAAASNSYYACVPVAVNNAGTAMVVKTTFSGTSVAYNATATVTRLI